MTAEVAGSVVPEQILVQWLQDVLELLGPPLVQGWQSMPSARAQELQAARLRPLTITRSTHREATLIKQRLTTSGPSFINRQHRVDSPALLKETRNPCHSRNHNIAPSAFRFLSSAFFLVFSFASARYSAETYDASHRTALNNYNFLDMELTHLLGPVAALAPVQ